MAYFSTASAPECRNPSGKNRVWDFFQLSSETHPANRRPSPQPRRKLRPTATKSALGIPYWPSRDPIEEKGGVNLYGFGPNSPMNGYDDNGRNWAYSFLLRLWASRAMAPEGGRLNGPTTPIGSVQLTSTTNIGFCCGCNREGPVRFLGPVDSCPTGYTLLNIMWERRYNSVRGGPIDNGHAWEPIPGSAEWTVRDRCPFF